MVDSTMITNRYLAESQNAQDKLSKQFKHGGSHKQGGFNGSSRQVGSFQP